MGPPITRPSRASGFSLIEVVVATALLVVAVGAGLQVVVYARRGVDMARDSAIGTVLAASLIDTLTREAFERTVGGSLTTPAPGYADVVDGRGQPTSERASARFERRWRIEPWEGNPLEGRVVRVRVVPVGRGHDVGATWRSRRPDEAALATLVVLKGEAP